MLIPVIKDRSKVVIELVDDSLLQRRDTRVDDEVELSVMTEYCWKDCTGRAHLTGIPDCASHFCNDHVHRSADVRLKKNVFAEALAGMFQ